ncbi:hypothetical protein TNCV_3879461 [Trichonephila clavipes]|nr:hypothetical protein TNCV_3879461 [Trichonephila clavipes]
MLVGTSGTIFNYKYPFGEELDTPSIFEKMSSNTPPALREGEGEGSTSAQKEKLTSCWNPSKMSSNQGEKQQIS